MKISTARRIRRRSRLLRAADPQYFCYGSKKMTSGVMESEEAEAEEEEADSVLGWSVPREVMVVVAHQRKGRRHPSASVASASSSLVILDDAGVGQVQDLLERTTLRGSGSSDRRTMRLERKSSAYFQRKKKRKALKRRHGMVIHDVVSANPPVD
jgi:hypothetical protein